MPLLKKDFLIKLALGAGIGICSALFVFSLTRWEGFFLKDLFDGYEFKSYDARFRARARGSLQGEIDDIVIIDIDQNSINSLGNYYRWPHQYHAALVDTITKGNPLAIVFDIIFDPEIDPNLDTAFINATHRSSRTFHALVLSSSDSLQFLYPMDSPPKGFHSDRFAIHVDSLSASRLPAGDRFDNTFVSLLNASRRIGSANFPQDPDGIVRRAPTLVNFALARQAYPSLSLAVAMDILDVPPDGLIYDFEKKTLKMINRYQELVREIPIDEKGRMYVNFTGTYKTFAYFSYADVLSGWLPPAYFENKVVLVGTSLPGLYDLRSVPVQESFPGVEIHANTIANLLKGEFVHPVPDRKVLLVMLILCAGVGTLMVIPKAVISLPLMILFVAGWVVYAYYAFFNSLHMWQVTRPTTAIGITYIATALYHFFVIEKDKRFLKHTFGTYISPELIEEMVQKKEEPKLGGKEGYHTAFFTDIQSFSSFSEQLSPTDLVELLNEYLTEMTQIILANKGTLDKYIGDAIVAFYGAPAPVDRHEYHACLTALQMQNHLAKLREKWGAEGTRWPEIVRHMQNRIGINSGKMVTGNMGSSLRMNYTMMGDTVNLAARLEASSKQYGIYIQVAESTYQTVQNDFIWRELDFVRVMGKVKPVKVYELISVKGTCPEFIEGESPPLDEKLLAVFQEGLSLYRAQKWDEALEAFHIADSLEDMFPGRKTNPSRVYLSRCEVLKKNPPGADWDGLWALTSK